MKKPSSEATQQLLATLTNIKDIQNSYSQHQLDNSPATREIIYQSVDWVVRTLFPKKFDSLCHVYAVVGSNVASILLKKNYRPVAGMAIFDAGKGSHIQLMDNNAFYNDNGGAYHCWIESVEEQPENRELLDFTFGHTEDYARRNGYIWNKHDSLKYLWGLYQDIALSDCVESLPKEFPKGTIWISETPEGANWLCSQIKNHAYEYMRITALTVKRAYDLGDR